MRPNRLCAPLIAVLGTLAVVMAVVAVNRQQPGLGVLSVLLGQATLVPTGYLILCTVIDHSRRTLLDTLLEALERTEQEVVQSITPRR